MAKKKNPQLELERKQQILLAAYKILSKKSYHKMTLCDVGREAKMSTALVFYYFKNKENLVLETLRFFISMRSQRLLSIAQETELPVKERVKRLIENALPSREEMEHMAAFLNEVWAMAKEHPKALLATREFYTQTREFCHALFEIGKQEGYVKRDDSAWVTLFLNSVIDGLIMQVTANPQLDVADIQKKVFRFFDAYLQSTD